MFTSEFIFLPLSLLLLVFIPLFVVLFIIVFFYRLGRESVKEQTILEGEIGKIAVYLYAQIGQLAGVFLGFLTLSVIFKILSGIIIDFTTVRGKYQLESNKFSWSSDTLKYFFADSKSALIKLIRGILCKRDKLITLVNSSLLYG